MQNLSVTGRARHCDLQIAVKFFFGFGSYSAGPPNWASQQQAVVSEQLTRDCYPTVDWNGQQVTCNLVIVKSDTPTIRLWKHKIQRC